MKKKNATANVDITPEFSIVNEIKLIQAPLSSEQKIMSWEGDVGLGKFSFNQDSKAETLEKVIKSTMHPVTYYPCYGDVSVSKTLSEVFFAG